MNDEARELAQHGGRDAPSRGGANARGLAFRDSFDSFIRLLQCECRAGTHAHPAPPRAWSDALAFLRTPCEPEANEALGGARAYEAAQCAIAMASEGVCSASIEVFAQAAALEPCAHFSCLMAVFAVVHCLDVADLPEARRRLSTLREGGRARLEGESALRADALIGLLAERIETLVRADARLAIEPTIENTAFFWDAKSQGEHLSDGQALLRARKDALRLSGGLLRCEVGPHGRKLVANRAIAAGTKLCEPPIVAYSAGAGLTCCSECLDDSSSLDVVCEACGARYCSRKCMVLANVTHHPKLCALTRDGRLDLGDVLERPDAESRYTWAIVGVLLRIYSAWAHFVDMGKSIALLDYWPIALLGQAGPGAVCHLPPEPLEAFLKIASALGLSQAQRGPYADFLTLYKRLATNAVGVCGDPRREPALDNCSLCLVYPVSFLANHACRGVNAHYMAQSESSRPELVFVRALRPGAEVLIDYADGTPAVPELRGAKLSQYGPVCTCGKCVPLDIEGVFA